MKRFSTGLICDLKAKLRNIRLGFISFTNCNFCTRSCFAKTKPVGFNGGRVMAKLKRRFWTAADVKVLKQLAKKQRGAAKIAKELRRTEGATRQKAFSLGLSLTLALSHLMLTHCSFERCVAIC